MATARQTLVLLAGLCGAVASSQAPELTQQYRQRLGGAIDELSRVVADFDRDAAASDLTREDALRTHDDSQVRLFRDRGASMRATIERRERLVDHASRLQSAPGLARPVLMATGADRQLISGTWRDFEPALPLTPHGFAWTGFGFVLGAAAAWLLLLPFRRRSRRIEPQLR